MGMDDTIMAGVEFPSRNQIRATLRAVHADAAASGQHPEVAVNDAVERGVSWLRTSVRAGVARNGTERGDLVALADSLETHGHSWGTRPE